jgi:superfamily I DNA and/or RNA helicase
MDLVIISSNHESEIGFLHNSKRLNVALTRAKYGLILIGTGTYWKQIKAGVIQEYRRKHVYREASEFLEELKYHHSFNFICASKCLRYVENSL